MAIQNNIDVFSLFSLDLQCLGDQGLDFRSWDEDDYVVPGMPITPETKRVITLTCGNNQQPAEFKEYHNDVLFSIREKIVPRLLNKQKGDKNQTLSLNIWTGTWNMGECDPPFNLEEWIPNSFDVIAIGVEECMSRSFIYYLTISLSHSLSHSF